MVEGPQCHRVANVHRKVLKGHAFKAISPNQRFTEGQGQNPSKQIHHANISRLNDLGLQRLEDFSGMQAYSILYDLLSLEQICPYKHTFSPCILCKGKGKSK